MTDGRKWTLGCGLTNEKRQYFGFFYDSAEYKLFCSSFCLKWFLFVFPQIKAVDKTVLILVLFLQLNVKLKRLRSHCNLYTESGEQISQSMDKKIESHFNQLLERVSRWNNSDTGTTEYDASSYLFARGHDALPIWYKNALKQSQLLNVEAAVTGTHCITASIGFCLALNPFIMDIKINVLL